MWHKPKQLLPTHHIWLIYIEQSSDDAQLTVSSGLGGGLGPSIIMKSHNVPLCITDPSMQRNSWPCRFPAQSQHCIPVMSSFLFAFIQTNWCDPVDAQLGLKASQYLWVPTILNEKLFIRWYYSNCMVPSWEFVAYEWESHWTLVTCICLFEHGHQWCR